MTKTNRLVSTLLQLFMFVQVFVVLLLFLCAFHDVTGTVGVINAQKTDATTSNKNLVDDKELLNAMEIFMGMSAQEREETIKGLMMAAGDDPAKKAEMEALIKMLPNLEDGSNLKQMIQEDEIAKAKRDAKRQLEGETWDSFWANQAEILDNVLASGQLSPEDAARFKTDEDAWKAQLKIIWDDLQKSSNNRDEL